ncbi:MAG TPA: hypothetical protein VMS63_07160 [Gaiellaceae bacterium]|nr:hypothetical protein [Gaiellaceae bacterium]
MTHAPTASSSAQGSSSPAGSPPQWYALDVAHVLGALDATPAGLSKEAAAEVDPAYGVGAAVATWLPAHVGVAWTLRARPGLPLRANPFFAVWAAAAPAVLLAATPLGSELGIAKLPSGDWWFVVGCALLAPRISALATRVTGLVHRL